MAREVCGLQPDQLRLGGPTVDAATIDVESQRLLLELAGLSGLVALAITWLRLRSIRLAIIILVVSVYSTAVALAILYYTGGNMNLVMTMLPPLVFVLSVSAAIHLVNYYRDALGRDGPSTQRRCRLCDDGWRPCVLASATTAIGLLSLAVSEIVPVKMFGIYAAAGMVASLVVRPAVAARRPDRLAARRLVRGTHGQQLESQLAGLDRLVDCDLPTRHERSSSPRCRSWSSPGLGLFSAAVDGQTAVSFRLEEPDPAGLSLAGRTSGPAGAAGIGRPFRRQRPDRVSWNNCEHVQELSSVVQQLPDVGAAFSGADFAPAMPEGKSVRRIARRVIMRRKAHDDRAEAA